MRVLGLDVGSKTIGVAITDELGVAAHALTTLARQGTAKDVARVVALVREHGAERVVVGLPYEPDGSEGKRAARVRVFMNALARELPQRTPIEPWDESFSTVRAQETLLRADLSRKKRKAVIDRAAAQVILQEWLEHR